MGRKCDFVINERELLEVDVDVEVLVLVLLEVLLEVLVLVLVLLEVLLVVLVLLEVEDDVLVLLLELVLVLVEVDVDVLVLVVTVVVVTVVVVGVVVGDVTWHPAAIPSWVNASNISLIVTAPAAHTPSSITSSVPTLCVRACAGARGVWRGVGGWAAHSIRQHTENTHQQQDRLSGWIPALYAGRDNTPWRGLRARPRLAS